MSISSKSISQQINTAFSFLFLRRFNTLLTIRGAVLLAFSIYLLSIPVASHSDIVGAVVSVSIITLLVLTIIISLMRGMSLRNKFNVTLYPPEPFQAQADQSSNNNLSTDDLQASSDTSSIIVLRTSPVSIPPFFSLTLCLTLESGEVILHNFMLTGSSRRDRVLIQKIDFPHRGDWKIEQIDASIGDRLGLISFKWKPLSDRAINSFRIYPPKHSSSIPPVISSSSKAGDAISDIRERHGDPYDLKPHHPSDGMRKVAWKIFAKTGELIARHSEHTMTPEGQTLLFCIADTKDDDVCASVVAYMKVLDQRELETFFSCEGNNSGEIARTPEEARDLLVQTVWNTTTSNTESVKADLSILINLFRKTFSDSNVRKVIVFCSERRLASQSGYDICKSVGDYLTSLKIEPIFSIIESSPTKKSSQPLAKHSNKIINTIKKICLENEQEDTNEDLQYYRKFLKLCGLNNWQVAQ